MPVHNGDFSPEEEQRRKLKREKVQRGRIRKRIQDGRATQAEKAAMQAWEAGNAWAMPGQADQVEQREEPEISGQAPERLPMSGNGWVLLLVGVFIAWAIWQGWRSV